MNKIAIIGGSGFSAQGGSALGGKNFKNKNLIFLQRHGKSTPPHKINHKKNISSLKKKGVKQIIGICSVGSLKLKFKPGSIVVPHDYINLKNIHSFLDLEIKHLAPNLDNSLRKKIINTAEKNKIKIIKNGVYIETMGPRFETKAEVKMIKKYADIVGMTMASEASLAQELGIEYASICMVDNYGNGISKRPISFATIKKEQIKNKEKIINLLDAIL